MEEFVTYEAIRVALREVMMEKAKDVYGESASVKMLTTLDGNRRYKLVMYSHSQVHIHECLDIFPISDVGEYMMSIDLDMFSFDTVVEMIRDVINYRMSK